MLKVNIGIICSFLCISGNSSEMYLYKGTENRTLLTNRKINDPNFSLIKTSIIPNNDNVILVRDSSDPSKRVYYFFSNQDDILKCNPNKITSKYCPSDLTAEEIKIIKEKIEILESDKVDAITLYRQNYILWEARGKKGIPPLKPNKIQKELVFVPVISEVFSSGKAIIDVNTRALSHSYETYNDCESEKEENITEFKKFYKAVLRQDIKMPKNISKKYMYRCESEVQEIHRQIEN